LSPSELADVIFIAAHWLCPDGRLPLAVIEANGAGAETIIRLKKLGYPNLYRRTNELARKQSKLVYGWHSSRTAKKVQLGLYRDALARASFVNPSAKALAECSTYVYYDSGGVGPITNAVTTEDERDSHGDRVIADMLAAHGIERYRPDTLETPAPPQGTRARAIFDENQDEYEQ
jgi:hypothetical protein